ncbi:uncharacterized protein J4E84_010229 [Alternaria hordeiaustralica]|uniref:uncharacterized protein n=1 Tax=Alternaria hordeiaustralica TaxID=1187925 RepID=UPI0020C2F878|nr:uncharacterized protein J4E84_010229 [Alternaria hordeiaustralica]KAI4675228.1 hypothetical protein J4E84_010229 [Alternaria hordeiaustralica]
MDTASCPLENGPREIEHPTDRVAAQEKLISELQTTIASLTTEVQTLQAENRRQHKLRLDAKQWCCQTYDQWMESLKELTSIESEAKKDKSVLREKILELKAKNAYLTTEIQTLQAENRPQTELKIDGAQWCCRTYDEWIESLKDLDAVEAEAEEDKSVLQEKISELEAKNASLTSEIQTLQSSHREICGQQILCTQVAMELDDRVMELTGAKVEAQQELSALRLKISELEQIIAKHDKEDTLTAEQEEIVKE